MQGGKDDKDTSECAAATRHQLEHSTRRPDRDIVAQRHSDLVDWRRCVPYRDGQASQSACRPPGARGLHTMGRTSHKQARVLGVREVWT